ncbi:MAG: hypothetical protein JHC93_01765 [Parachlamydiales bacterium]|nr:hypothetical protein [Parachlamydiales bacterium]
MRKVLLTLFLLLVIIAAVGLFIMRSRAASYLSEYLTETMQVPVHVGDIKISFTRVSVIDLTIENPPNSAIKYAFQAPRIDIDYVFSSAFKEIRRVREIYLDNPTVGIEIYNLTGSDNNWARIITNMNNNPAPQSISPKGKPHSVEIETLLVEPLHITYYNKSSGGSPTSLTPIDKIELHNIGTANHSISYSQALNAIAQTIIMEIIKQRGLMNLLQGVTRIPQDLLESILPGDSNSIFNKAWDGVESLFKGGNN